MPFITTPAALPASSATVSIPRRRRYFILALELLVVGVLPVLIALRALGLFDWDFSVPLHYAGSDDVWQLVLTKMVRDTGWFLDSPFLGAPDIAHWHYHSAAQTSSLHSIIMCAMSWFIDDAVRIQQIYYVLNFALISLSAYATCRMLGLARFAAGSIGYLFAFTSYRLGWAFYAFLVNYAAVPLAFAPVLWILTGQYATDSAGGYGQLFRSRKFWLGLLFVALVTLSDGYYAFFTLLMLAFAVVVRVGLGDFRQPIKLLAPLIFLGTVLTIALAMTLPLRAYQKAHIDEFFPDGKEDSTLVKHNYEAEVYSSSLKLMIAPLITHRVPLLAKIGRVMVDSSDQARKIPIVRPVASLGSICSLLLIAGLIAGPILLLRRSTSPQSMSAEWSPHVKLALASGSLAYFIFLCSIAGGVGSLVALVYPTIRAYERFPLFLAFALLVAAGSLLSGWVTTASKPRWLLAYAAAVLVTIIGLFDQIPTDFGKSVPAVVQRFLAERKLVHSIEQQLPTGTMVYQYPHSQYLNNNAYYGWASFAHMRLYLHSQKLRWSNGASKNSPVESWHDRIASLPTTRLLDEVSAAGFRAMVIDRTVVPAPEYEKLKAELTARGLKVQEDRASDLAWLQLPDPGYRVAYDSLFTNIDRIIISDRTALSNDHLPRMINSVALRAALAASTGDAKAVTVTRLMAPTAFVPASSERGMGNKLFEPLTDMKGALICAISPADSSQAVVKIENKSDFDWKFGSGTLPFKIGAHIRNASNAMLRFDDGMRVKPGQWLVPAHESVEVTIPLSSISPAGLPGESGQRIEFAVLQEGHAWFEQLSCQVPFPNSP